MGKLKIKISNTEWQEITSLDNLFIANLTTNKTPIANTDVVNKEYLDNQIKIINNTIKQSGGLYVANSSNLAGNIPAEDQNNKLWIDTNTETGGLKYYNGSAWVYVPVAFS